jgi:hypothetical protein
LRSSKLYSVEDAALVGWDHVLDVDECILSSVSFEHFKCLLDKVSKNEALALRVLNLVAQVGVALLEKVHHWQDLSVVRHKSLADGVTAGNQGLQNLKSNSDNLWVASVEGS